MTFIETHRRQVILWLCCTVQFMVIMDISIVNVALPSIARDLRFAAPDLQWVVNAYTLALAGFLLLGGRASDLWGPRLVFIGGLALFTGASLACGLAQTSGELLAARGTQGLGAAVVAPTTLSILMTTFSEGPQRNRALGIWGASAGLGGAAGSVVGGALTAWLSWRWVFFINVPVGVAMALVALRAVMTGRHSDEARGAFDAAGALTATAGLVVLTYGIVGTHTHGWGSAHTLATLSLGLALLGCFVIIERFVAREPLVPLKIFRTRAVAGTNLVVFFMGATAFGMWYFLSLYLQNVLGFSALRAGAALLPMSLAIMLASRLAGRLSARLGPGRVLAVGLSLTAVGMLLLSRVSPAGSFWTEVFGPTLMTSFGLGLAFVTVTIVAMSGVSHA
ncbi:MAG TPA: MFS transporter, partial [Baekduia sp.]|nr:MFS transporter [Baekduia sp.]